MEKKTSKKGLGRGINSLIPKSEKEEKNEVFIKTMYIEPNKSQPRKTFDEKELEELALSIKEVGIIQPLIVKKKDDKYYEIIAGERRFRAAKMAKLKEVPVIIREYSEKEEKEVALIENLQRKDLNPIEEALAFQNLIDEYNLTQEEVAKSVSKSRTQITNTLRLLKLDEKVRELIIENKLSKGHARCLVSVENKKDQYKLAIKIIEEDLNVRETEKLIANLNSKETKKPTKKISKNLLVEYEKIEEELEKKLGNKVKIKTNNGKNGKIEIAYSNQEELENLYNLLNK